jgi:HEAT repeat protein
MAQTVSSLLARGLVGIGQEDVAAIGEAFPDTPGERRRVALEALADYLLIDSDTDRLGEVLGVWADDAAAALRLRDEDNLALLIRALSGILGDGVPAAKRSLAEATMRRVLSSDMLAELITLADEEGRAEAAAHLLRPFGDVAVDALLDELAQEQDRGRRAVLLGVLAEAARGHHHRVAGRLSDSRWFVARNAVTVLYRSGDPEVLPALIETFHHREPAVRREAVRGVLAVAGLDALPQLLTLSADPDASVRSAVISSVGGMTTPDACQALARLAHAMKEPADRRQIIEALARHPSTEGAEALAGLASAKARPRLPRRIRRHAKARLRNRRAVASS